jgi:hypothetical protein
MARRPAEALTGNWPELTPHPAPPHTVETTGRLENSLARAARLSNEQLAV